MKKIFLCTTFKLCDNNGYLTTQLSNFFKENKFELVREPEDAECIVITTCGFDQERENESAAMINAYIEKFGDIREVIVTGCLTKINPELFESSGVTLIGNKELDKFNDRFNAATAIDKITGSSLDDSFISREYGFVDAYYLQICQGCVNNCSYCAIKKSKGQVESKPIEEIVAQMRRGYDSGFRRFMLLGDDCGSYGADIGVDLAQLLNRLNEYDIRLLVNYIEPGKFLSLYPKIDPSVFGKIDFMNIPVQATSGRVIGLMDRNYDVRKVTEIVKEIKANSPQIYLETHVIFGFPSETREEFRDTLRLAEFFDAVIYFCYTDRKNVKSATLPGKISDEELKHRMHEIVGHPRFTLNQQEADLPLILLGYGQETSEILKSIEPKDVLRKTVALS